MQASESLKAAIQNFDQQLDTLQTLLAQEEGDMQVALVSLQALFQEQIRPQVMANSEQWVSGVSMVTEMNRHLRILGVDLNFLRAAKQTATRQQRQQLIGQRLASLQQFSQGLLTLIP